MIIEKKDGTRIDVSEYNLKRLNHIIPSISVSNQSEVIGSTRGTSYIATDFIERVITVTFLCDVYDIEDYYLTRDRLNDLFVQDDYYYIIFKNEAYKRYKVRLNGQFVVPPTTRLQSFDVEFLCVELYGESISSTQVDKLWDSGIFGWNNTINWDETPRYTFLTTEFTLQNIGTAIIDPRVSFAQVTIIGNFPSGLRLRNITTGDTYEFYGPISTGQLLVLDGVRTLRGGENQFSLTNRRVIRYAPGPNNFILESDGPFDLTGISFNLRFLYK